MTTSLPYLHWSSHLQGIRRWVRREKNRRKTSIERQTETTPVLPPVTLPPLPSTLPRPRHTAFTMFRVSPQRPHPPPPVPQADGTIRVDIGAYAKELGRAFKALAPEERARYQQQADAANTALDNAESSDDPAVLRARYVVKSLVRLRACSSSLFPAEKFLSRRRGWTTTSTICRRKCSGLEWLSWEGWTRAASSSFTRKVHAMFNTSVPSNASAGRMRAATSAV